ncbi:hypothetical protein O2K51_06785 [Apibacter raozihei]|uniref:hypothetical protein n=1 Tax=Apibacter raozihei TaxID=2500547 RepID=UPI000FE3FD16|nr:hypothetical protein [Apibacter raozihei]
MKNKIRQIIVNKQILNWRFRTLNSRVSHVLIFPAENKTCRIRILFRYNLTYTGGNPFNEGLPFKKGNETIVINLNQPRFINEFLLHILKYENISLTANKEYAIDGLKTLEQLGYKENKLENILIKEYEKKI